MKKLQIIGSVAALALIVWIIMAGNSDKPQPTNSPTPSASSSVSPSPSTQPNITITSPTKNQYVDGVITVTGKARVFENQFTIQVKDSNGKIIATAHAMTDAKDAGLFGNYSVKLALPTTATLNLKVESLAYSAKGDGSFEGYASADVKLRNLDTRTIYVAYVTSDDCTTFSLFKRDVLKTTQPGYLSLVELLKGPTSAEKSQHAKDVIPSNVVINSLKQSGTTVNVDFDETLQAGVAGSCRVQAIRSEITNTLKQFPGFNNVVISINGKTEGILQP